MTAKSTKPKMGRPSKYTEALAERICFELAQGKSLRTVCKEDWCPDGVTIFSWMRKHEGFLSQYARAKQESADAMAEDILDIADTQVLGETKTIKGDGSIELKLEDMLGHRRLQIDTRKWLMAKMKPKKYSEKFELEDLPQNAIIFVNEVPGPTTNPTGDLLPDAQTDSETHIS